MQEDIKFTHDGCAGKIILNRPQVLNALTHKMTIELKKQLDQWSIDQDIKFVIIEGAGDKAFCAGGDIKSLYDSRPENDEFVTRFYGDEYLLNMAIKAFPKPYISIMDGIVMGGGVGVTVPGTHRIVTERTICAMPETGIGLIPDVGSTFYLARAPKYAGIYLGLTGTRMNAADSIYVGFADHFILSSAIPDLLDELVNFHYKGEIADEIRQIINTYKIKPEQPSLERQGSEISRTFSKHSVEEVIAELQTLGTEWGEKTLKTLNKKSPTSLKLTLRAIKSAQMLSFNECIAQEYRVVVEIMKGHDIYEGIRALIIEKDNAPQWRPNSLDAVSESTVEKHFQLFCESDLREM